MSRSKALKRLQFEQKTFKSNPPFGCTAEPCGENYFKWDLVIDGPEGSFFEGGKFQATMTFPADYPMSPPELIIKSEIFHPNVYPDGRVCVSILHPPGKDPFGCEDTKVRWNPLQSIATIITSVRSLISAPNANSPANVDAAKMFLDDHKMFIERAERSTRRCREKFERDQLILQQQNDYDKALMEDKKKESLKRKREDEEVKEEPQEKQSKDDSKADYETAAAGSSGARIQSTLPAAALSPIGTNDESPIGTNEESSLPKEPTEDCGEEIVNLRFRTPTGDSFTRRFLATDCLSVVLQFLIVKGFPTKDHKVLTSWSKKDLTRLDHTSTIRQIKLAPQETLTLVKINSED